MRIYAHRGSSGIEPENTPRAFQRAIHDGAHGVEFDVRASADGVPVVIHDRDLLRTANGTGFVDALSLKELQRLDAGNGERIPTLAEVLTLLAGRLHLDIEIKQPGIEREILAVLDHYPDAKWALSSFHWSILRAFRERCPTATLWPLTINVTEEAIAMALELGSPVIALNAGALNADASSWLAQSGLKAVVWTVNDVPTARAMQVAGAIGLCTDYPAAILNGLKNA